MLNGIFQFWIIFLKQMREVVSATGLKDALKQNAEIYKFLCPSFWPHYYAKWREFVKQEEDLSWNEKYVWNGPSPFSFIFGQVQFYKRQRQKKYLNHQSPPVTTDPSRKCSEIINFNTSIILRTIFQLLAT